MSGKSRKNPVKHVQTKGQPVGHRHLAPSPTVYLQGVLKPPHLLVRLLSQSFLVPPKLCSPLPLMQPHHFALELSRPATQNLLQDWHEFEVRV